MLALVGLSITFISMSLADALQHVIVEFANPPHPWMRVRVFCAEPVGQYRLLKRRVAAIFKRVDLCGPHHSKTLKSIEAVYIHYGPTVAQKKQKGSQKRIKNNFQKK